MLVLKRFKDESIVIADGIEVRVMEVRGQYVRLGIEAPKDVKIHRKEVYDIIKAEEDEADD